MLKDLLTQSRHCRNNGWAKILLLQYICTTGFQQEIRKPAPRKSVIMRYVDT